LPHELAFGGIFVPPMLVAAALGVLGAAATARFLNRRRWSRFFRSPPLVFLSFAVIYTIAIGSIFIGM
jgi:hypothetical protein